MNNFYSNLTSILANDSDSLVPFDTNTLIRATVEDSCDCPQFTCWDSPCGCDGDCSSDCSDTPATYHVSITVYLDGTIYDNGGKSLTYDSKTVRGWMTAVGVSAPSSGTFKQGGYIRGVNVGSCTLSTYLTNSPSLIIELLYESPTPTYKVLVETYLNNLFYDSATISNVSSGTSKTYTGWENAAGVDVPPDPATFVKYTWNGVDYTNPSKMLTVDSLSSLIVYYVEGGVQCFINTDGETTGWRRATPYINTTSSASGWKETKVHINDGSW